VCLESQAMSDPICIMNWRLAKVHSVLSEGSLMPPLSPVYRPREPTNSPLWKILHNHYGNFKTDNDDRCERQYGFFRPVANEVVEE
jgi:hypothetical protein